VLLERLRLDHAPLVLAFERENRAYFAASIPDRGDDYFAHFESRHRALLAERRPACATSTWCWRVVRCWAA
jgi:hypothetical protein